MPFGISLTSGKSPKPQPRSARLAVHHASVQELRPQHRQQHQQQQLSMAAEFRLTYLGKQALSRPNSTGFGSVQKPLREIYLSHLVASKEGSDRLAERIVSFDGADMQLSFWDEHTGQRHQECYPLDSVAYLELVLFHTIKGKKRHFGYFRRHTDSTDVAPDSVLIPLHKKDHKLVTRVKHRPMLCLIMRRPYGIQFLECHVYQLDCEQTGVHFIGEFDSRSRQRQEAEKRSQFSCQQQQHQQQDRNSQLNKWASQPLLLKSNPSLSVASDLSEALLTPASSLASSRAAGRPAPTPQSATPAEPPAPEIGDDAGPIRRSASGTIFDKYKELEVFNIPEYEYMGFQELQQIRIQHKRQHQQGGSGGSSGGSSSSRIPVSVQSQRPPRPPTGSPVQRHASSTSSSSAAPPEQSQPPRLPPRNGSGGVAGSAKFPSDGNIKAKQQQQPQQQPQQQTASSQFARRGFNYASGQDLPHHRPPSIILEEAGGGGRGVSRLAGRFDLPPTPTTKEAPDAAKPVARVVPTARQLPCLDWRWQQQQHQQKLAVGRSSSTAMGAQQHRIHHRSGGSAQHQQRRVRPPGGSARLPAAPAATDASSPVDASIRFGRGCGGGGSGVGSGGLGSTPDFAAALGYLP